MTAPFVSNPLSIYAVCMMYLTKHAWTAVAMRFIATIAITRVVVGVAFTKIQNCVADPQKHALPENDVRTDVLQTTGFVTSQNPG